MMPSEVLKFCLSPSLSPFQKKVTYTSIYFLICKNDHTSSRHLLFHKLSKWPKKSFNPCSGSSYMREIEHGQYPADEEQCNKSHLVFFRVLFHSRPLKQNNQSHDYSCSKKCPPSHFSFTSFSGIPPGWVI